MAYAYTTPVRYTAVSRVLVEEASPVAVEPDVSGPPYRGGAAFYEAQLRAIRGAPLVRRVAKRMYLASIPEFRDLTQAGVDDASVVSELQTRIEAEQRPSTNLVSISFNAREPAVAADGANLVARESARMNHETRLDPARREL